MIQSFRKGLQDVRCSQHFTQAVFVNPLKRVRFAYEPPKRQRTEPTPIVGRVIGLMGSMKMVYSDGKIYEGDVVDGLPHGLGKISLKSGKITHEGGYQNGRYHGYGAENYGGRKYFGDFQDGAPHGYGALYSHEGELLYDGFWYKGMRYVGELKDGKPNGFGTSYNYDGQKLYSGEWRDGNWEGYGEDFRGYDHPVHIGYYKNGKEDGYGTMFWNHNWKLRAQGTWKEGKWHGAMTYTYIDGTRSKQGIFDMDNEVVNK